MRFARAFLLLVILAALLAPEPARYRAERLVRAATDALRLVITHPGEVADPPKALDGIALAADSCVRSLPGDPRPLLLEGSARLVRGEPERAAAAYRLAFGDGERAEIDLNLARAYEGLGREADARAAYVRAAWISPMLLRAMLPDSAALARAEVARLDQELKAGRLTGPPPMPMPVTGDR